MFFKKKESAAPSPEKEGGEIRERAKKELQELGLEANPENIETVTEQMQASQFPDFDQFKDEKGVDAGRLEALKEIATELGELAQNPEDPTGHLESIKKLMLDGGVVSIVHAEGPSLWDHVHLSIQEVEGMELSDDQKSLLKLVMLHHDIGKMEVSNNEKNKKATLKKIVNKKGGALHQSMIGHAKPEGAPESFEKMRARMAANGLNEKQLRVAMLLIENHMAADIVKQKPSKTVELFDSFGDTEEERKEVVKLLGLALLADGSATKHLKLDKDGELTEEKNVKKIDMTFDKLWGRYELGLKEIAKKVEQEKKKAEEAAFEESIFGGKLSKYLSDKGLKGKEMGMAMKKIKGKIKEMAGSDPADIKKTVDAMEL